MAKYRVQFETRVWVNIDVEAEDKEDAIAKAWEESPSIGGYSGNGGSNKLIGVWGDNMSIEASDIFDEPKASDVYQLS